MPNPEVLLETLTGYARYAGTGYSRERLAELAPDLQELMDQLRALWEVELGTAEMALILPSREAEP
jgi:hypothetical protein